MTLLEIQANAERNPGSCAVCGKRLPKHKLGGRPPSVCSVRIRKSCKRGYAAAYRLAKKPRTTSDIVHSMKHPSRLGFVLATLSCGHSKSVRSWDVASGGRRTTKCLECESARKKTSLGSRRVVIFEKQPRAKVVSG